MKRPLAVALLCLSSSCWLACDPLGPDDGGEGEPAGEGERELVGEGERELDNCGECAAGLVCSVSESLGEDGECETSAACVPPASEGQPCAQVADPCGGFTSACESGLACVVDRSGATGDGATSTCRLPCDPAAPSCSDGHACAYESDPFVAPPLPDAFCFPSDVAGSCLPVDGPPFVACPNGTACNLVVGSCEPAVVSCEDCTGDDVCLRADNVPPGGDACTQELFCVAPPELGERCATASDACDSYDVGCADGLACTLDGFGDDAPSSCRTKCDPLVPTCEEGSSCDPEDLVCRP